MSKHEDQFVNLTVEEGDAAEVAEQVRAWLAARGLIGDHLGDGCYRALPTLGVRNPSDLGLVTLEYGPRRGYSTIEGYEGPLCTPCGAPYQPDDGEGDFDYVNAWYEHGDIPTLTCKSCGWTAQVVEWNLECAAAVGRVALVTDTLKHPHAFCDGLNSTGTGRWVYVQCHL